MFQIAAIALTGAMLSLTVRAYRPEFSLYISIICGILLFIAVITQLEDIMALLSDITDRSSYGHKYFYILIKILAIAYITDFVAQICKDAGENGIASKAEMAGKIFVLYVSLPVFTSVISIIEMLLSEWG